LFADDFFCVNPASPAIRLQRVTKLWNTPEFTLEEVVAGVPWRKQKNNILLNKFWQCSFEFEKLKCFIF